MVYDNWITVEEGYPDPGESVLLSFDNLDVVLVGRFECDEEGNGAFYIADRTAVSLNWFVNAWQPLPRPYRED